MCNAPYCPLHTHSEFSALDGAGKINEMVEHYLAAGLPGGFITDHGTVAGWQPFQTKMAKAGLFAGVGMEAYQAAVHRNVKPESFYEDVPDPKRPGKTKKQQKKPRDAAHLILVAQNATGMRNIKTMSEIAAQEGFFYHPRLDWELLEKYNEGVIATSACLAGLVAKGIQEDDLESLNRYLSIFGDRFYLELHAYRTDYQREVNEALKSIALERGIPCVPASDAHYCDKQAYPFHELMLDIQMGPAGASEGYGYTDPETGDVTHHPQDLFIMDSEEIVDALSYLGDDFVAEAVANTHTIMELCKDTHPIERTLHLPVFTQAKEIERDVPNNRALLLELMEEGLVERYGDEEGNLPDEVVERAAFEFEAIAYAFGEDERGLEDYFLITWDFLNWCYRNNILTGPGRGSAGGSILAYALGITHVDPIRFGLFFERFWNPGRSAGLPDIDNDVPQAYRHVAKEYLSRRWGAKRVRDIGTHIRLGPKSALDKAIKPLYGEIVEKNGRKAFDMGSAGWVYGEVNKIKKIIEQTEDAGQQAPWQDVLGDDGEVIIEGIYTQVGDQLAEWTTDERFEGLFEVAEWLTGRISTYGVHASAVIVSDVDLTDLLPGRMAKDQDGGEKLVTQIEMNEVEELGFLKMDVLGLRNLDTLMETLLLTPEFADLNPNDVYKKMIDFDNMPTEVWELLDRKITLGLFQIEDGNAARRIAKEMMPRSIEDLAAIVALNRPGPLRSGMVDRYFARKAGEEAVTYHHELLEPILGETFGDFLYQEQVLAYFRAIGYTLGEADDIRRILGKKKVKQMHAEHPRYMERAQAVGIPEKTAQTIWDEIIDFSKYSFNKSHAVAYGVILVWTLWAKATQTTNFIMASIVTNQSKGAERIGAYVNEGRRMGVKIMSPDINRSVTQVSKHGLDIVFGLRVKGVGEPACEWIIEEREANGLFENGDDFLERLEAANKAHLKLPKDERPAKSPKQRCNAAAVKALVNVGAFDILHPDYDIHERAVYEQELIGVVLQDLYSEVVEANGERLSNCGRISDCDTADDGDEVECYGVVAEVNKLKLKEGGYNGGQEYARVTIEWEGETITFVAWPEKFKKNKSHLLKVGNLGVFTLSVNPRGVAFERGERLV